MRQNKRTKVLNRDDFRCQECGKAVGKAANPHVGDAHIHHKTPRREGGTNDLGNLETLCDTCHRKIHGNTSRKLLIPDELDSAILDYFLEDRPDDPWGKATPSEVYRALDERGTLENLGNPVRQTVQNRIQRLALADHLENKFDSGSYEFVSDPRE